MAKLLVIDDEVEICELIKFYLGNYFSDVSTVQSVPQAIGKLKDNKFDLIITDLDLVSGTGESLIRYVRRDDSLNHATAIIVISGGREFDEASVGHCRFVKKPFREEDLIEKIKDLKNELKKESSKESKKSANEPTATHPDLMKLLKKN